MEYVVFLNASQPGGTHALRDEQAREKAIQLIADLNVALGLPTQDTDTCARPRPDIPNPTETTFNNPDNDGSGGSVAARGYVVNVEDQNVALIPNGNPTPVAEPPGDTSPTRQWGEDPGGGP